MKLIPTPGGPFSHRPYYEACEIDRECCSALKRSGYLPSKPQPIDIERYVEKTYRISIDYRELPDGILGCTEFSACGAIKSIIIREGADADTIPGERRLRSTLAHEAGHCLLHGFLFLRTPIQPNLFEGQVEVTRRRILCRDIDIKGEGLKPSYDGRWWEWQANRCIGGFLLPSALVNLALTPLVEISSMGLPTLPEESRPEAVRVVSELFQVNPIVARIRLSEFFPRVGPQMEF